MVNVQMPNSRDRLRAIRDEAMTLRLYIDTVETMRRPEGSRPPTIGTGMSQPTAAIVGLDTEP